MNELIELLAYKIGEGVQASATGKVRTASNIFHRPVAYHTSGDLSFIIGLIETGLRGSALLGPHRVIGNYEQLKMAVRHHIPLVVQTSDLPGHSNLNPHEHLTATRSAGCFQLTASTLQDQIYLTLIAQRIAELSLMPGIVISNPDETDTAVLPPDHLIKQYLGSPDDMIESPSPAQEMIFGHMRRRIPNWNSLDLPVMLGGGKDPGALSREAAAHSQYFMAHLPQLIEQAYKEFQEIFGMNLRPISSDTTRAKYAIIFHGNKAEKLAEKLPNGNKNTSLIRVNLLHPFPTEEMRELLTKKKAITILEAIDSTSQARSTFYNEVANSLKNKDAAVYSARYSPDATSEDLEMVVKGMISGHQKKDVYLGLNFTRPSSGYPIHKILLQEIDKNYPGIAETTIYTEEQRKAGRKAKKTKVPLAVRMYRDKGPVYSRLSDFYNNIAFFYDHQQPNELVADPMTALPVSPGASAGLFNKTGERTSVPVLDTLKCTGCGDCFVHCPHSAIPPIAIDVEGLVLSGIKMAAAKGHIITKLPSMLKNLAKLSAKFISGSEIRVVKDFLPASYQELVTQLKLEDEKLKIVSKEMSLVLPEIASLPVAVTEDFFTVPTSVEKGSGELFSLAVDPASCTGCGICSEVCAPDALSMEVEDQQCLDAIVNTFGIWENLPDIKGSTINRLHHDKSYSSMAAMMLSRSYYLSMSGANFKEHDTPYKTLLHIITAAVESVVQPRIVHQIEKIDGIITALTDNVHQKLSNALPKDDLEALSRSLKHAHDKKLSLEDMVHQLEDEQGPLIDTGTLERKTDLARSLKNLKRTLAEGPTGIGRSRYSMLLAGLDSLNWTRQYPVNNFSAPTVIHWNGSAPDRALGQFHGHLRFLLDNIKLMRRASMESKDQYDPSVNDEEIAALTWEGLTDEEKQLVPPVLLIAEKEDLHETGWNSLNQLLAEKYPLKVFLLDHASPHSNIGNHSLAQTNSGLLGTIGLKSAFVFQGGLGNIDHLFDGLLGGLSKTYPALFNLYATKHQKHGTDNINWEPYAALALNSRAFPALRYDPGERSDFLSGTISLDGNNAPESDWVREKVDIPGQEAIEYTITWADWALTQEEWKEHFLPLESKSKKMLLSEYVALSLQARKNHKPAIMRAGAKGLIYYSVSPVVVEMTETVRAYWRTLREIAGLLTEFPLKLRSEITKELSLIYEQQSADLKEHYEKKLQEQEAAQAEELRQQLKAKLVALAGMARKNRKEKDV